jgi:ParB-like chromosome segregation protein Spo0J
MSVTDENPALTQGNTETVLSATARALEKLEAVHAPLQAGRKVPRRLPLSSVRVELDAFQVRGGDFDDAHVTKLGRLLDTVEDLTPILVLPCSDGYVVIDGHHRRKAYQLRKRKDVPVIVFNGTVREAALEAVKLNTQATLQMDNQQRGDCAWRLVLVGSYTRDQIVSASGVSETQVANMRRVLRQLGSEAYGFDRWMTARWKAKDTGGEQMSDDERETWKQQLAQDWADRLRKEFASKLSDNPEIAAMALAIHFGRKRWELALLLREQLSDTELDQLATEENPEDDETARFY